ncbi:MAG: hypothetical protein CVU05_14305 [Bacteroidetes bacterium HGW-Bacteroidetes-21]|jgi:hypothetical protein|nr:MAG: hypothetical protein CVU05_14305 [Bacteroidetes bacterium HGW-Bacteroidetes-21]
MKSFLFLFVFLLCSTFSFSQQWSILGYSNQRINAVAVHPQNPNIIFCAGDNLYKSVDGGTTWDTVFLNTPFNSIYFYPEYPDTMFATLGAGSNSDGIYKSTDGGEHWANLTWIFRTTSIMIPFYPQGTMLAGTLGDGVLISSDYGQNWTPMNDSIDNMNVLSMINLYPSCIPEDPINLYLAGTHGGIFFYPEHTWLTSPDEYWHNTNMATNAIIPAISRTNSGDKIWAAIGGGSYSDGMYYSENLGSTWLLSDYWPFITDILINAMNSTTIYAADSGSGVKRTINDGLVWETINNNLGDLRVHCLGQSPLDTMRLYAGTQAGLYVYNFTADVQNTSFKTENVVVFPNPANDFLNVQAYDAVIKKVEVFSTNGKLQECLYPHTEHVKIQTSSFEKGIYIVRVYTENTVSTFKINR